MIYGISAETIAAAKHWERPRFDVPGHTSNCNGIPEPRIRFEAGRYHPARACACGALRHLGVGFDTFTAACAAP